MSDSLWYTLDRGVIRNTFVANYFLKTTYFLSATVAGYFCFVILGYLREAEWTNSTLVKNLIAIFPVLPAICGILQLYIWRIPFECLGMTISVMMVFINCLKQQISQDGLADDLAGMNSLGHL